MPSSLVDHVANYMNIISNSTVVNVGAPVFFKQVPKKITISSVDYEFIIPGSQDRDVMDLVSQVIVTAENGTTPTVDLDWQGCMDPCDSYTRIADATIAADATTINVTAASGAAIGTSTVKIPALLVSFSSSGSPRVATKFEWVLISSISTDALTVSRGAFGTTAQAFTSGDFLFYSNSWAPVLDSGAAVIKNDNFDHDGATAAAPLIAQLSMSSEGLTRFPYAAFRLKQAAPSSGGITYKAHLALHKRVS